MNFATKRILLLTFIFLCIGLRAQNEFISYSKDDGLTSSSINFVFADSKGVLWAATNTGVNAYASNKWIQIKSIIGSDGKDQNIGRISHIFESSNSNIWISSDNGLFLYNREFWTHYSDQDNKDFTVKKIFEDDDGLIWLMLEKDRAVKDIGQLGFSVAEGRLQMFDNGQWYNFPGMIGGSAAVLVGEPKDYFTSHFIDSKGYLWITSLDGLYVYDRRFWKEFNEEHLPSDKCYYMMELEDGEIWVATAGGLAKKDGEDWKKFENEKGLKDNLPYKLFEDNKHRLWAITKKDNKFKSLCLYDKGKWLSCYNKDLRFKGELKEIYNFKDELIAFSKKGISLFNGEIWTNITNIYDLDEKQFSFMLHVNDSSIWFSGEKGVYNITSAGMNNVFFPKIEWKVNSIVTNSKNEIWIATEKNGVYMINKDGSNHYDEKNGLSDNHIKQIIEDKRGRMWVVSKSGVNLLK